jgi:hypothetical protein
MPQKRSKVAKACLVCGRDFFPLFSVQRFCSNHCSQSSRHAPTSERFWMRVSKTDGCWNWTGYTTSGGYGTIHVDGQTICAHRYSYVLHVGPIPDGVHVCHKCDNRRCVRPDHLFLGTRVDNMQDAIAKGRLPKGEKRGHAKLNDDCVRELRQRYCDGATLRELASRFKLSTATVHQIVLRRTWKHVG